jgi:branched-chain amino acid transport system substrate-binding protein
MKMAGKDLTREKLFMALESMRDFDLGGLKVNYSSSDHEAFKKVWLMQIKNGKATPLD